jgi:hypothetical protein
VALASDLRRQVFDAIELSLAGDRPLRLSVRFDARTAGGGEVLLRRPGRADLRVPRGHPTDHRTAAGGLNSSADVTSILLVIDLTNAAPAGPAFCTVKASALVN